jgi:hypothetical protein
MSQVSYDTMASVVAAAITADRDYVYVASRGRWFIKAPTNGGKLAWWPDEDFSVWHRIHWTLCEFADECRRDDNTDLLRSGKTANAVELILRSKLVGS